MVRLGPARTPFDVVTLCLTEQRRRSSANVVGP